MLRQTDDRGTEQCIGIGALDTRDEGLIDLQLKSSGSRVSGRTGMKPSRSRREKKYSPRDFS